MKRLTLNTLFAIKIKQAFIPVLFCCFISPLQAQITSYYSDTLFWGSPVRAEKAREYQIRNIIIENKKFRRVPCPRCKPRCEDCEGVKLKFRKETTVYELDSMGYPISISESAMNLPQQVYIKNEYQNGRLLRSESGNSLIKVHYNRQNLRDTCTWYENGRMVMQQVYSYDSLSRIVQSDIYHPYFNGKMDLTSRSITEYDTNNRPWHNIRWYRYLDDEKKFRLTVYDSRYTNDFKNLITYGINHNKDTISINTTTNKGNRRRKIKFYLKEKTNNTWEKGERYQKLDIITKGFRRQRQSRYNIYVQNYIHLLHKGSRHLQSKEASDKTIGLLLKRAEFRPRQFYVWKHQVQWRRLFLRKIKETRYIYLIPKDGK